MKKIYKYILCASLMVAMMIGGQEVMWGNTTYYVRGTIKVNSTGSGTAYVSKTTDFSSASADGSVSFDKNEDDVETITINATAYLKAVAIDGYHFDKWLDGSASGTTIGTTPVGQKYDHDFTIQTSSTSSSSPTTVTQNVYATFAPNYTTQVTAYASEGGAAYVKYGSSFSGTATEADDGYGQTSTGVSETYSIKATANTGYHFKSWSATNGSLSSSSSASTTVNVTTHDGYTYTSSRYPCKVTASFEQNYYIKLTTKSNNASFGTVSASASTTDNSETASQSRSYTLTATPKANCHFVSWSKTDGDGNGTISGNTFTGKTSSSPGGYNEYTVTGTFAENFYATLNTVVTTGTSGSASGGGTKNVATSGGSCEFNLTAPEASPGYYFTGWTGTGISFTSPKSLSTKATVNASTTGGSSKAATYTATANYAEYSRIINITASGTPDDNSDQVTFVVAGSTQSYRVAVQVGGSVTLKNVASGDYTITPQGFSWVYIVDKSSEGTSWSYENISNHTFIFTPKGSKTKHSEAKVTIKP